MDWVLGLGRWLVLCSVYLSLFQHHNIYKTTLAYPRYCLPQSEACYVWFTKVYFKSAHWSDSELPSSVMRRSPQHQHFNGDYQLESNSFTAFHCSQAPS